MCFAIPLKVIKIGSGFAVVEGNKKIKVDKVMRLKIGNFIQVNGNIAIDKLSSREGLRIRKIINNIYKN